MQKLRSTTTLNRDVLAGPRSGGVLALAMIVVLTVAALAAGMLQLSSVVTRRQAAAVNTKLSFYMAESGLTEAYAGLTMGRTGNVGSEAEPVLFGDGLFWVEATENADGTTTLESTGMVGNGRAVLSFVVRREVKSVASLGMFAAQGVRIGPGVTIDTFDPEAEEGEEQEQNGLGGISSNGPITIQGTEAQPVVIVGNVMAGPEYDVELNGTVEISGITGSSLMPTELPPVETPAIVMGRGVRVDEAEPYTILPGEVGLAMLQITGNSEVIIRGPVTVVIGELNLKPEAKLTLDATDGEIKIFVLDVLRLEPDSLVETIAEDATGVSIQVPGPMSSPILLAAKSEFHGAFYAPEANVRIFEEFEVFGSLVGNTLDLNGSMKLHYDLQLDAAAAQLGLPELISWRIVELSNPSISVTMDPFRALGVERAALDKPADAHEDQLIRIKYLHTNTTEQTYSGLESGFDWDTVERVYVLFRDGVEVDLDAPAKRRATADRVVD